MSPNSQNSTAKKSGKSGKMAGNQISVQISVQKLVKKTGKTVQKKQTRRRDRIRAALHQNQTPSSTSSYIKKIQAQNQAFKIENAALKQLQHPDDARLLRILVDLNTDITHQMNTNDAIHKKSLEFKNQIQDLLPHYERCHEKVENTIADFKKRSNKHEHADQFVEKIVAITKKWKKEVELRIRGALQEREEVEEN